MVLTIPLRSVYKELHADHETGAADNKTGWISSTGKVRDIQPVLLSGVSKGAPFGTRLCLQSVVCYTLCRRCCENAVANREGKSIWSSKKTRLWLCGVEPQAQGWFHQQTGRIWKPPSLVLRRTSGQNVPNLWTHSRKSRGIFLLKLKWAGSHFRAFPPWLPISKDGRDCQRRRICAPFILTVDWLGWLCYLPDKQELLSICPRIKIVCASHLQ